jgi:hypothetical protein
MGISTQGLYRGMPPGYSPRGTGPANGQHGPARTAAVVVARARLDSASDAAGWDPATHTQDGGATMAGYLALVQDHAEQEWRFQRSVQDPRRTRLARTLREQVVSHSHRHAPKTARLQAGSRWLGEQLVRAGLRLGAEVPDPPTPARGAAGAALPASSVRVRRSSRSCATLYQKRDLLVRPARKGR